MRAARLPWALPWAWALVGCGAGSAVPSASPPPADGSGAAVDAPGPSAVGTPAAPLPAPLVAALGLSPGDVVVRLDAGAPPAEDAALLVAVGPEGRVVALPGGAAPSVPAEADLVVLVDVLAAIPELPAYAEALGRELPVGARLAVVDAAAPDAALAAAGWVREPSPSPGAEGLAGLYRWEPWLRSASHPPEGWVDLREAIPGAQVHVRYHTADNFVGAPLEGYGAPGAWLRAEAAAALAGVHEDLAAHGYGLRIYDAYRPLRGTLSMVAWAHRTGQVHLLDTGYIARRSGHNRGHTVDLSLYSLADGREPDMGTAWDTLSEASHTRNATGAALERRLLLKAAMEARGFQAYWKEWWHFTLRGDQGLPHRDVPYGCFEAAEGAWTAPAGWHEPSWTPPAAWPAALDCAPR